MVGNDGNMGGVAEAQRVRGAGTGTMLMLAPGSGLGCAFVDARGLPLDGDTLSGMEAAHMPAPLHLLDMKPYPCGCGRTWGCVEVYTTISGLPYLLAEKLAAYPNHPLATSGGDAKQRVLSLRGLAQKNDPLALEIFDFQARALGLHVASLAMALDPQFVVIGGGLMDPEATTEAFRNRLSEAHPRDRGPLSLAAPAGSHQRYARRARRPVAGDRRGPRRAVSRSRAAAPSVRRRRPFVDNGGKRRQRISETKQRRKRRRTEKSPRRH